MKTLIKKIETGEVEMWLHPKQHSGYIGGNELYEYLQKEKLLNSCLDLDDLKEIQKQGVEFFKKNFGNNFVCAWKGIVRSRDGDLDVPCFCVGGDGVVLYWRWTDDYWDGNDPALRFASSTQNSNIKSSELSNLDLAIKTVKEAGYKIIKEL